MRTPYSPCLWVISCWPGSQCVWSPVCWTLGLITALRTPEQATDAPHTKQRQPGIPCTPFIKHFARDINYCTWGNVGIKHSTSLFEENEEKQRKTQFIIFVLLSRKLLIHECCLSLIWSVSVNKQRQNFCNNKKGQPRKNTNVLQLNSIFIGF